jgi:hypothetical protein
VRGVKGSHCTDLTRDLEEALGILEDRTYTEEYYEFSVTLSQNEILKTK